MLRAQKAAAWQEVAQRIAHEIKNPLTPIQLSAERLTRYLDRNGDKAGAPEFVSLVGECAALIGREVGTLEGLVNEFSQFARFPVARLSSTDPNEIVRGALDVFHGRLDDVSIHADLAPDLPPVKADAELLRRVMVNLIDNAAEAMEGSSAKQLELTTRFHADHETVEISVADSGHGISPEDKDKLFLPHFSTKERGTGLGLAIASRIIAEHHGVIRAEDNLPTGARFIIELPVAEPARDVLTPEALARRPAPWPIPFSSWTTKKASAIPSALFFPRRDTSSKRFRAARSAWRGLQRAHFDLVLMDIWLPKMDGLETLERMRQQGHYPMVVMISGHGNIETAVRATKLGAFDFIEKPLSIEKTTRSVKNALEFLRLEEENRRLREELG